MAGKREKPEDIVLKLRQVEVLQGQGKSVSEAVRQIGVTIQTYYRWRKEYGGMNRDPRHELKSWILRNGHTAGLDEIEDATPLIEQGILSSLQIMDLILYLEELRGAPIRVEQLAPGSFCDVDTIVDCFFEEAS